MQTWKFFGNNRHRYRSFPQIINTGNDNSFLQHFFLKITFWTISTGKGITIRLKNINQKHKSQTRLLCSPPYSFVLFSSSQRQPIFLSLSLTSHARVRRHSNFILIFLPHLVLDVDTHSTEQHKTRYSNVLKSWKV